MKKNICAHNHNLFDLKYLICLHIRIRIIDELFQRSNTTIEPDILNRREFIIEQQPPLQKKYYWLKLLNFTKIGLHY